MPKYEVQINVTKTWLLTYAVEADTEALAKLAIGMQEEEGNLYWHTGQMQADSGYLPDNIKVSENQEYPRDVDVHEEYFDFENVTEKNEREDK